MSPNTRSSSMTASVTATSFVQSACPSCPYYSFTYSASPKLIYLNTTPYNISTHIEVHMWGGQGGGNYGPGGTGAFITGILPLSGLGNVLRVLVGSCGAPDAGQTQGAGFQYAGGGRTAIQIPDTYNLTGTGWLDIVTAGGGGGSSCGTNAVPASSGNWAASPGGQGPCIPTSFACTKGAWLKGGAVTSTGSCLSGGGGGWCGGLSSPSGYSATGGGTSRTDQLLCFWGKDAEAAATPFTKDRYYLAGVNSWGGSWGCVPGNNGLVAIVPLNFTVFSLFYPRCNSWARAQSCSASASGSASFAGTFSSRPTVSISASQALSNSSRPTASISVSTRATLSRSVSASAAAPPCPAGTFMSTTGICQQCPGGHYCPAGTSSWAQLNCGRGNYCPGSSSAPKPCPYLVPPTGGWGALQVQGPAFLVETSQCLNSCFWNITSGDGMLSKC